MVVVMNDHTPLIYRNQ